MALTILYVGDIMGAPGVEVVEAVLPQLIQDKQVDLVIAQAENVTAGRGINAADFRRLQKAGINFCTGGNWSLHEDSIIPLLNDPAEPIIRPANYPEGTPGLGVKLAETGKGSVLVVSLLGKIVGKDADVPTDNPLRIIDSILAKADKDNMGVVINLHGDFSSEKVIIGHYLDGRATLVVGDHWHVPTADARVLPGGTAHITDVGMCGVLDSSLGIAWDSVIPRWRDGIQSRNVLETAGPRQFNAVLVQANDKGLAESIELIQKIL